MYEYFKGWRRKFGLLTLLLALPFLGGWVRSFSNVDTLIPYAPRNPGKCFYLVISERSAVKFVRVYGTDVFALSPSRFFNSVPIKPANPTLSVECRWQFCGFEFRDGPLGAGEIKMTAYVFPYWAIVIPLTVVSAYLLLTTPRKSIQKQNADTILDKVA